MSNVESVVSRDEEDNRSDTSDACEACKKDEPELFFCALCQCTLCAECWTRQLPHKKKNSLAPGGIPHEKTQLQLARHIHDVFSSALSDGELERLHLEDYKTAWLGVGHLGFSNDNLFLRDYGRYARLILGPNGQTAARTTTGMKQDVAYAESCFPGLVSFVGQTGAGKSTLIRLLIKTATQSTAEYVEAPIAGTPGQDLSTTAGIHLYADPSTVGSAEPFLYVDSQGLDGGTRETVAGKYRRTGSITLAEPLALPIEAQSSVERSIGWAKDDTTNSTDFAVAHLYPRILFTFSDVVLFVHRNPRTIEDSVLDKLIEWAVAVESSSNQPILPCAILVLNCCENNLDPTLWDVDNATRAVLDSLAETVDNKPSFKKYADAWKARDKQIQTVEDLILCYYSSFKIVRIPTNGRPNLIHEQAQKLYAEIERGVSLVHQRKSKLRMLLHGADFQIFFQKALNHFCAEIEKPFDFVQTSFFNSSVSSKSTQNFLALALSLKPLSSSPSDIFVKLGILIASCIMLETVRNEIKGTADRILPHYAGMINAALAEFCYKYCRCEYFQPIDHQYKGSQWTNDLFFGESDGKNGLTCVEARAGHGSRGHHLEDGSWVPGDYISSFSVELHRKTILDSIYYHLHHLLESLSTHPKEAQFDASTRIHKNEGLNRFFITNGYHARKEFKSTNFCISCIFETAYYTLHCGHSLCIKCIKVYGRQRSKTVLEIKDCPLHPQSHLRQNIQAIRVKPHRAGIRVLSLDDGGVTSVIQIEILKLLEKEFLGRLSLQCFFDLIVGQGTGGVLALGLGSRGWTAQECETNLTSILEQSFTTKSVRRLPSLYLKQLGFWKYHSKPLETTLMKIFTPEQRLLEQTSDQVSQGNFVRVAVRAQLVGAYPILFTNYISKNTYTDLKLWESARVTMSQKTLFKSFVHNKLGPLSIDDTKDSSSALTIAAKEIQAAFGEDQPILDVVLSLGCCATQIDSAPKRQTDESWQDVLDEERARSLGAAMVRLQVELPSLPSFDDLSSIQRIQEVARSQISPKNIQNVAMGLFASLFYLDSDSSAQQLSDGRFSVFAQVLCRLPDNSTEMHGLGELMQMDTFNSLSFVFREESYTEQIFAVPHDVIKNELSQRHQFNLPEFHVHLIEKYATVFASIQLPNGEHDKARYTSQSLQLKLLVELDSPQFIAGPYSVQQVRLDEELEYGAEWILETRVQRARGYGGLSKRESFGEVGGLREVYIASDVGSQRNVGLNSYKDLIGLEVVSELL